MNYSEKCTFGTLKGLSNTGGLKDRFDCIVFLYAFKGCHFGAIFEPFLAEFRNSYK